MAMIPDSSLNDKLATHEESILLHNFLKIFFQINLEELVDDRAVCVHIS